jgi:hypothetical protein
VKKDEKKKELKEKKESDKEKGIKKKEKGNKGNGKCCVFLLNLWSCMLLSTAKA